MVSSLKIRSVDIQSYQSTLATLLTIDGEEIFWREGFYFGIETTPRFSAQGESAPLGSVSFETLKRVRHELILTPSNLMGLEIPVEKEKLFQWLKKEPRIANNCASVRFAIESVFVTLAAHAHGQNVTQYLGGNLRDVHSACLLQGSLTDVMADVQKYAKDGSKVFKLKVGNPNIALDVKKVQNVRAVLGKDCLLRLDGNRGWHLEDACLFAELVGLDRIEFIEEPLRDVTQVEKFYQQTGMPVALDETLLMMRPGIQVPVGCALPITHREGVAAYVIKPMILGFTTALDWVEEARLRKRKAIISSLYETWVGFEMMAQLACLSDATAGLGTERWFRKSNKIPLVGNNGVIRKEALIYDH